jgi:hypothetical protein
MTRARLLVVTAVAALFFGATSALAAVGASTFAAAQPGVHATEPALQADMATASDPCKAADAAEDKDEKAKEAAENKAEKTANLGTAADAAEDKDEKAKARAEDKAEKAQLKACEAARKPASTKAKAA